MKILPVRFQEKDQALGRKTVQESTPNAYRQAIFVSDLLVLRSFFETQGHTMSVNDVLNGELYNDNLKMLQSDLERQTLLAFGNDMDEKHSRNVETKDR